MIILDSELDLTKYYKIKYLTDTAMTELCSKNNSKRKKILKKEKRKRNQCGKRVSRKKQNTCKLNINLD